MVVSIPTDTANKTHNHLPPATDLPFGLIILAIYIVALTFHTMFVTRPRAGFW
jgi:hypothetical protein